MRVAHVVAYHGPYDVRVFYKQCRSLAAARHDVYLVAPEAKAEQRDGVQFRSSGRRIALPTRPGPLRRVRMLGEFLGVLRRTYAAARAVRADVYHVHEPWLILVGLLLKAHGARVVYDAHEEYREIARGRQARRPIWGRLLRVWYGALESTAYRLFDLVIAATPAIARQFPRAEVVYNYPLASELENGDGIPYRDRPRRVVYAGGISRVRGIHEIVAAMGLVPPESGARLDLVGSFASAAEEAAMRRSPGWESVDFHGWCSREEMRRYVGRARAGVVTFHPVPNHTEAMPNKLLEYMAAGIPVIASDFPLWRGIVDGARCGLLVDPLDAGSIAAAIRWVFDHPAEAEAMGRRGAAAVRETLNWDLEAAKLLSLYERFLQPAGRDHSPLADASPVS